MSLLKTMQCYWTLSCLWFRVFARTRLFFHTLFSKFVNYFVGNPVFDNGYKQAKSGSEWDLSTGHAFECPNTANAADRLRPEREFMKALMLIGKRLASQPTKDAKTHRWDENIGESSTLLLTIY